MKLASHYLAGLIWCGSSFVLPQLNDGSKRGVIAIYSSISSVLRDLAMIQFHMMGGLSSRGQL